MKKFLFFILLLTVFNAHARTGFLESLGLSSNLAEPPLVEDAFQFEAFVKNANTITATWRVMDGNYLYRDKLQFALDNLNITILPIQLPSGENKQDEFFGLVEVYQQDLTFPLSLERNNSGTETITITAQFQGCSDTFGICYPPSQQHITLNLPTIDADTAPTSPTANNTDTATPTIAEQDTIAQKLAHDSVLEIILGFLGLGLLLTFTPCVLPMIPILSSVIVGEGERVTTRRAFTLSLVYVLAMSVTYTVAGILTGLLGANLQATFQNIWVISAFSLLFVVLALSMFGLYELQLPQRLQHRLYQLSHQQRGGKLVGVAIMGLLSGLIVGPCLAPPLAGALIFISQSADPFLGGLALFSLSMGMGIPLLIIGTSAGKLLPKAGGWMITIKSIFGVLLIGLALWMLERILPGWFSLILWGVLLIVVAVYMGALEPLRIDKSGWHKLFKGLGLTLMIYGTLLIIGGSGGNHSIWQPLQTFATNSTAASSRPASLQFQSVNNLNELHSILSLTQQPVMLDFYADWCVECKIMERTTFQDPRVINALQSFQLVKLDMTDNTAEHQAMLKALKVFGPPTMLFFDNSGDERRAHRIVGQITADKLLERLAQH